MTVQVHGGFVVLATEKGPVYSCPRCGQQFPDAKPYAADAQRHALELAAALDDLLMLNKHSSAIAVEQAHQHGRWALSRWEDATEDAKQKLVMQKRGIHT